MANNTKIVIYISLQRKTKQIFKKSKRHDNMQTNLFKKDTEEEHANVLYMSS